MTTRRQWLTWCPAAAVGGWGGFVLPVAAQVSDLNDAINKSGRMRMLSQRMAKSYCAIGQSVVAEQADDVLGQSMGVFERQMVELKAFSPSPAIRTSFEQLEAAWLEYKPALVGARPTRVGADKVLALSEKVLGLAQQATVQLEGVSGKPVGRLVNVSGRQRMLSQRMAASFLLAAWGVDTARTSTTLRQARDEFATAHGQLKAAPETTAAIRSELGLAEMQFAFFQAALESPRAAAPTPTAMRDVFTTSERILQVMDKATGLYARLAT
jgi:hypothetical protein